MVWLLGFSQLFKLFLPKYKRQNKKIMILPSSPVFLPERFFLENQEMIFGKLCMGLRKV